MTSCEVFERRKFKLMMAALKRIDCNRLCFIRENPFNDLSSFILSAYSYVDPLPNYLVFIKDKHFHTIGFDALKIYPGQLVYNPLENEHVYSGIDPFDYEILFDSLMNMNTWIGTMSGKTLLAGNETDICHLEIDVDLYDDGSN